MTSDLVVLETGAITTIRLNNPPLNLISKDVTVALDVALDAVEKDRAIRAVIVTGTGDHAFCAGSDINEFTLLLGRVGEGKLIAENATYSRLANLAVPTVAAIQADALGGGLELALCCDLRVAVETARLGLPEVRLGVIPGSGGLQRLPRLIGLARAKELTLLGEIIDATTALNMGLVNRVAPSGQIGALSMSIAETLASRGPIAVREAKAALDAALDVSLDDGLARDLRASERVFSSDDMVEGTTAFLEKRPATFKNR